MSNKRPGTVDYSKFDNIDSDSESESEDSYTPNANNINKSQFDSDDSEDDISEDSVPSFDVAPIPAVPSPVSYCLFTTPFYESCAMCDETISTVRNTSYKYLYLLINLYM